MTDPVARYLQATRAGVFDEIRPDEIYESEDAIGEQASSPEGWECPDCMCCERRDCARKSCAERGCPCTSG